MRIYLLVLFCAGLSAGSGLAQGTAQPAKLAEVAAAHPPIPGAPKESDVCMRSLCARPANRNDPYNTLDAIQGFHVTWLEWTYSDDPAFIRKVHGAGAVFGAAASAGSYNGNQPKEAWNVRDRRGKLVFATWMRAWKSPNPWGCANDPEFRAGHLRFLISSIDAGADLIQRDEPGQNKDALRWGGCFCDHCMKGFNGWLAMNGDPEVLRRLGVTDLAAFDYRDYLRKQDAPIGDAFGAWPGDALKGYFTRFQIDSSVEFHRWWRGELSKHAGRRVPVSCNNGVQEWTDIERVFDYCIGELDASNARPEYLYAAMRKTASLGKTQSVTMPLYPDDKVTPERVLLIRQSIAAVYALGGHIEMPWDTYLPTPDAKRFFGKPEKYADLTAFVRGMAKYLDGYADAAVTGNGMPDTRWTEERRPVRLADNVKQVFAFARAIPGRTEAPLVIHLIDWRPQPKPFTLSVQPDAFFGVKPLRYRLFTPVVPYDKTANDKAFKTKDYSRLVRETELPGGYLTAVQIPALAPWGILVVGPAENTGGGVWQPLLHLRSAPGAGVAHVVVQSVEQGATVRYTLDGTEPTASSPLYSGPVEVSGAVTIKARAFVQSGQSAVVAGHVVKADDSGFLSPDSPALKDNLKLWLSAKAIAKTVDDGALLPKWAAMVGPAAETPKAALFDGKTSQPPVFSTGALNGHPCVRFNGENAELAVAKFATEALGGKAMTVIVLSNSEDSQFGLCGNEVSGRGGDPRLYMTRGQFNYGPLQPAVTVGMASGVACVAAYTHDGVETARAYVNGAGVGKMSGLPVVREFGAGGHLAMPFWANNSPHKGDLAEVLVYDRALSPKEVEGISKYLGRQYDLGSARVWTLE